MESEAKSADEAQSTGGNTNNKSAEMESEAKSADEAQSTGGNTNNKSAEKDGHLQLANIIHKIKEAGKCPVCMTLAKPPTLLCGNGHVMCKTCASDLSRCPLCNQSLSFKVDLRSIKLVTLDNILNELPRTCENDVFGCNYTCAAKDMFNNHKFICDKRIVQCRIVDCNWNEGIQKIKTHLKNNHKSLILTNGSVIHIKHRRDLYVVYPVFIEDLLIWKHVKIDSNLKTMFVKLECYAANLEQIKPILIFSIKGLQNSVDYTCTNYAYKEDVNIADTFNCSTSMIIPLNLLDDIYNNRNFIRYKFKIKKFNANMLRKPLISQNISQLLFYFVCFEFLLCLYYIIFMF